MRPPHTLFALALLATACQPGDTERVWRGETLTVTSVEGVELCGGSIGFLDAYVGHVSRYWGADGQEEPFSLELRASGEEVPPGTPTPSMLGRGQNRRSFTNSPTSSRSPKTGSPRPRCPRALQPRSTL